MKKILRRNVLIAIVSVVLIMWVITSFSSKESEEKETLILATTTSTYDSGLLDYLLPDFQQKHNADVMIIPVGTGQAIKNGENGDADIILVHAPDAEKKFVEDGFGINRKCVMYNDFIILGIESDPAEIKGKTVNEALKLISESKSDFISRGDDSGTHKKEVKLWATAKLNPEGDWYKEVGAGMSDSLRIANDLGAYILTDRGTYFAFKDKTDLVILVEGDNILLNPYGIIEVNPKLHKNVNNKLASEFSNWLMEETTQKNIADFKKNGEQLFKPLEGRCLEE